MQQNPLNKIILTGLFILIAPSLLWSQSGLKIVDRPISFGRYAIEHRNIDVIIIHSSYNSLGGDEYDINLILKEYSRYKVGAHYLIGRDGTIYRLVAEKNIAYHAGRSMLPDGRRSVNRCSIGIELMISKKDTPTEAQIKSLTALVKDIESRYRIKYLLRHSDIAPGRKTDPWNMDWDSFLKGLNSSN